MPNTYDYRVLREMYRTKYGAPCTLKATAIVKHWHSTRPKPEVRRREVYAQRAGETVDLMRQKESEKNL